MRPARGFTLIELMIVIAIIAILAAILIPNFLHARFEAQIATGEDNLRAIATAMEEYAVDNAGVYTASINGSIYMPNMPSSPADSVSTYTIAVYSPQDAIKGSYQILDGGKYDNTAMPKTLQDTSGNPCQNNKSSLLFYQKSGVHCG